jgi:DNA gyrase subunit A
MEEQEIAKHIIEAPVEQELQEGFLAYSLSVIHSRAIPDVRDGLKPVQRRILYGMYKQRLRSDAAFRKSARVVGFVMGAYHPHGDSAIYEAMVRMGQEFSLMIPLVEPHGNFGSLDDPPAASRYTESRLTKTAEVLLNELDEGTVDFRPNYDGEETEPVYLPAGFPNLLVNGTSGIAVGMTTAVPPHNLVEVAKAVKLVLDIPDVTLARVMKVLPAPDFPGGGEIIGAEGIKDAYATGKGSFRLRARTELVSTGKQNSIAITELPYLVGPERVVAKIGELVRAERLDGIADVRDLSDRKGIRLMVDLKPGVNPQHILRQLCKLTPIEETVSINMIVLADGEPQQLPILDIIQRFITHRLDVVVRRSQFRLDKAEHRAHLVEGLVIALGNIDKVVSIIKGAKDTADARTKLQSQLKLSEAQAEYILEMQLRRLTRLEAAKLKDELAQLKKTIAELKKLLKSEALQRQTVWDELDEVVKAHGTPRRTTIVAGEDPLDGEEPVLVVNDDPTEVVLSDTGLVARTPQDGWKGRLANDDLLIARLDARTTSDMAVISADGSVTRFLAAEAAEADKDRGSKIAFLAGTQGKIASLVGPASENQAVVVVTANGVIKRLTAEEFNGTRPGSPIIKLQGGDEVVSAFVADDNTDVVMITNDAQLLRTSAGQVRPQGRAAGGMAGMRVKSGARIIGAWPLGAEDVLVTAASNGKAKVTPLAEYPAKGRGTGGVRCQTLPAGVELTAVWMGAPQTLVARIGKNVKKVDPPAGKRDAAGQDMGAVWDRIGASR